MTVLYRAMNEYFFATRPTLSTENISPSIPPQLGAPQRLRGWITDGRGSFPLSAFLRRTRRRTAALLSVSPTATQ